MADLLAGLADPGPGGGRAPVAPRWRSRRPGGPGRGADRRRRWPGRCSMRSRPARRRSPASGSRGPWASSTPCRSAGGRSGWARRRSPWPRPSAWPCCWRAWPRPARGSGTRPVPTATATLARGFGILLFEAVAWGLLWSSISRNALLAGAMSVVSVALVSIYSDRLIPLESPGHVQRARFRRDDPGAGRPGPGGPGGLGPGDDAAGPGPGPPGSASGPRRRPGRGDPGPAGLGRPEPGLAGHPRGPDDRGRWSSLLGLVVPIGPADRQVPGQAGSD